MAINWDLGPRVSSSDYLGPLQAMAAGRQASIERHRAQAHDAAISQWSSGDLEGAQRTAIAGDDLPTAESLRLARGREAAGKVFGLYGSPPQVRSLPGPQSTTQALIAAGGPAQAAPPAPSSYASSLISAGVKPSGNGLADAPPDRAIDGSPLENHAHETAVEVGHAAMTGQPVDPTQVWGTLYSLDPEMGDKVMGAVKNMDELRRKQVTERQDALGSAAQTLLGLPEADRAVAAVHLLPQLGVHGVTSEMLTAENLSDAGLKGLIGQAIGVKGMIEQVNKETKAQHDSAVFGETVRWHQSREQADQARIAETGRRDRARESGTQRGQDMTDARVRGSAGYRGIRAPHGGATRATAVPTATGAQGEKYELHGKDWVQVK